MSDHYNMLGVSPSASVDELRRAFRREAKRCHPDLFADLSAAERESQRMRFIQLAQAYQLLSDPGQRKAYDSRLKAERERQQAETGKRASRSHERPSSAPPRSERETPRQRPAPRATEASAQGNVHASKGSRVQESARAARQDPSVELREILKEAEQSLSKFGMNLRQPADVVLEELLDWARALYRDLVGAVRGSATRGSTSNADSAAEAEVRSSRQARPQAGPHVSPKAQNRSKSNAAVESASLNELNVERELANLKRKTRKGPIARASTVDDELAELKRRLDK